MIKAKNFYNILKKNNFNFFTGVPDSMMKEFCTFLEKNVSKKKHVIAANEGSAVALAAGHYLSSGNTGVVYMQNSGLGNAVNPITSLIGKNIYSIPVLFLIGWRGHPGYKDEPQHTLQGKITPKLLKLLNIPFRVIDNKSSMSKIRTQIASIKKIIATKKTSYALLFKKNSFKKNITLENKDNLLYNSRINYIKILIENFKESIFFSTTGYTSRELAELKKNQKCNYFLSVGSMGHVNQIALGVAKNTNKKVMCLDGDGSMIMHLGSLASYNELNLKNIIYLVFNNECHLSVGGQKSLSQKINFEKLAYGLGFKNYYKSENIKNFKKKIEKLRLKKSVFIEVKINNFKKNNLIRPKNFYKMKNDLMRVLNAKV